MNIKNTNIIAPRKGIDTTPIFQYVQEAVDGHYSVASFQGGSRSGKTYNIMIWLIVYAMQHPMKKISVVRVSRPAVEASAFEDFETIMYNFGIYDRKNRLNRTKLNYTFENGTVIEFIGSDDQQRIRGRKRDILFCNEANEISVDVWNQLRMRTTTFTILDYNPSFNDDHWLCGVNKDKKTYFRITTYKDNPFLEQEIVDWIEGYQGKNESMWQIYGLGLQRPIEGLVYPIFHVVQHIPETVKQRYLGIDFGFVNDPTTIIEVGLDGDNIYVDEVAYKPKLLSKDILKIITERPKIRKLPIVADSEDPKTIFELQLGGLTVEKSMKGGRSGSVIVGIEAIQQRHLHVTETSLNILKELRNYTFEQKQDGTFTNTPIDKWNHAMDAIRYVVYNKALKKKKRRGLRFKK